MASTRGEEHHMPTMASAQGVAALTAKEDATSNVASTSSNQLASGMNPSSPASMHPLLLAAAHKGDVIELSYLLSRDEQRPADIMMPPQGFLELLAAYTSAAADLEQGTTVEAPSPASLLEGVTMEGDTALHVVAANGDSEDFMNCADLIHGKDRAFLSKQNTKGDTPLHCAVRAGNSQMVSHLVDLARTVGMLEDLLRKENRSKETVLHQAVRIGDNKIVKNLLTADPELACFPKEGTSALYLAISLEEDNIAETLHEESRDKIVSYLGPNGQNVLHAAVLRGRACCWMHTRWIINKEARGCSYGYTGKLLGFLHRRRVYRENQYQVLTRRLLEWKKDLVTKVDENGRTPLHFAAGSSRTSRAAGTVAMFVNRCHISSRLRDARGRTFLHVAVEEKSCSVVSYACGLKASWILNMQDNDGNTALHLAVKAMHFGMVCALVGTREVNLNLTNAKGETPLDTAENMIIPPVPSGCKDNRARDIHYLLNITGGTSGVSRWDHFNEMYENVHGGVAEAERQAKQAKVLKESTQSLLVGSVLVATATFGAAFAMPGGYRQDDHPNGGTPTLARSDAFAGFVMADAIAFIFSTLATAGFMYSGNSKVDLLKREAYFLRSTFLLHLSVITMVAAFSLGIETVLIPVSPGIVREILLMVIYFLLAVHTGHYLVKWIPMAKPVWIRKGPVWTIWRLVWVLPIFIFIGSTPRLFQLLGRILLKQTSFTK